MSRLAAISKVVQASQDTPPLISSPTTSSELVACAASCSSSQVPGASEARGERAGLGRACFARSLSFRDATTPWNCRQLRRRLSPCSYAALGTWYAHDNTSTSKQNSSGILWGNIDDTRAFIWSPFSPMDKLVTASVLAKKSPSDVRPTRRMLSKYEVVYSHPQPPCYCLLRALCVAFPSRLRERGGTWMIKEHLLTVSCKLQLSRFSLPSLFFLFLLFQGCSRIFFTFCFLRTTHMYRKNENNLQFFIFRAQIECCVLCAVFPQQANRSQRATVDSGACRGRDVLPEAITCVHSCMHSPMVPRPEFFYVCIALSSCDRSGLLFRRARSGW